MDNVLLRPMHRERNKPSVTVGQLITVKDVFSMLPRGENSAVDPELTMDTVQRWLTNPLADDLRPGSMCLPTRILAIDLARQRLAQWRDR